MHAPRMFLALLATFALVLGVAPAAHAEDPVTTYIVRLKPGVSAKAVIPTLMGSDATIIESAFSGGIGSLTASQAAALETNPSVASVRVDTKISTSTTSAVKAPAAAGTVTATGLQLNAPWNLDILDSTKGTLDGSYTAANDGTGVTVYVVDTGIYRQHSQFANITVATGAGFGTANPDATDCDGQGTAVSSLIAGSTLGASKAVRIVPLRVLDCNGGGNVSDLIAALNYVVQDHVAGTPAVVDIGLGADASADVDTAVQNVIADGVTVVVAARFSPGDACLSSPGRVPGSITVAASTASNTEASSTSYGSCVDLYAPGQDVTVADISGTTATAVGAGTAYSAALVAGVAAQILHANPTWTPAQVWSEMSALTANGRIAGARSANKLLSDGAGYPAFIKASFQDFLGHQPTAAQLVSWSGLLFSGSTTNAAYLTSLAKSDEWLTTIVTKMYADTLNRTPDPAGLAYWVGLLRAGTYSVATVASLFYSSDEYYTKAGGSPDKWVSLLYQQLLNRTADPSGLQFWVANTGTYGRNWVAYNFYQSQESRSRRVEGIYQALLFREPDPTGWVFWTDRVLTTGDLQLAWEVASSAEYWQKAQSRY